MKKALFLVLALFLGIASRAEGLAHDIVVEPFYYNFINDGTELEVSYYADYDEEHKYAGDYIIPEEVTYEGKTYKVTAIGERAFMACINLGYVSIPRTINRIGDDAFREATINILNINDLAAWCGIDFAGYYSNPLGGAGSLIADGSTVTDLVIPEGVTSISNLAFQGCKAFKGVTLPSTLKSIGEQAFRDFTSMESIYMPYGLTSIGHSAFSGCTSLGAVNIPNSITSIPPDCFRDCTSLAAVTIPNSVTEIGNQVFYDCPKLSEITLPSSVTSIGRDAFELCNALKAVNISDLDAFCNISFGSCSANPLMYAHRLFQNGVEVTKPKYPQTATAVHDYAFYGASNITRLTIPSSVKSIGTEAFYGCTSLVVVTVGMEDPYPIDENCFSTEIMANATLCVQSESIDKYLESTAWSRFFDLFGDAPKCATPVFDFRNGNLYFTSYNPFNTQYTYSITCDDVVSLKDTGRSFEQFTGVYQISVYASAQDAFDSDVVTATLTWSNPVFTDTTPSVATSAKPLALGGNPILITANGGDITVKSEAEGQKVVVYSVDGQQLGSAIVRNGEATIDTPLKTSNVAVVKVGDKSVKVMMR
ncbi:MAG: leucine-rich repeat domain-containing protein [Prevotella sp.]|nr:leucine-rich repeat domain-containing protein [Prevotella sp.]